MASSYSGLLDDAMLDNRAYVTRSDVMAWHVSRHNYVFEHWKGHRYHSGYIVINRGQSVAAI